MISVATLFRGWETGVDGVTDSKKLSPDKRSKIFKKLLRSHLLVDFGVGEVSVDEINEIGIDEANVLAFQRALCALPARPHTLVVDGTKSIPGWVADTIVVPKADELYPVVGAASILAKVARDSYMDELATEFPDYHWEKNKGYGTKDHQEALKKFGPTTHHRTRFIRGILNNLET
jgi:ribonuclease HII